MVHVSKSADLCASDASTLGTYCAIVSPRFIANARTGVAGTTIHLDNNIVSIDVSRHYARTYCWRAVFLAITNEVWAENDAYSRLSSARIKRICSFLIKPVKNVYYSVLLNLDYVLRLIYIWSLVEALLRLCSFKHCKVDSIDDLLFVSLKRPFSIKYVAFYKC